MILLRLVSVALLCAAFLPEGAGADDAVRDPHEVVSAVGGATQIPILSARVLAAFYAGRGHRLAWQEPEYRLGLLRALESSGADGFVPEDFHLDVVRPLARRDWSTLDDAERRHSDLVLSDALLRYVHHQRYGKVDPVALDAKWHDRPAPSGAVLVEDMHAALAGPDVADALAARFQRPFWYDQLKVGLQRLLGRAPPADLPPLLDGPTLAVGVRDPRVAQLRDRLAALGLPGVSGSDAGDAFDPALAEAVKSFQRRVGLTPDGLVGPVTRAALNGTSDADAIERLRANLERMRWLAADLPSEYVFVDVADFMVHLVRDGRFVWSDRAIVGTFETQTPMFRDNIDHLVFNPTWSVPTSIQKKMARVGGDFKVVERSTGRAVARGDPRDVSRYRLVQQPGPKNALGRVKFMFPNRHAIYLHDTASKGLFDRTARALSNGCVRVRNPLDLAERILARQGWAPDGIDRVVARGTMRYVDLDETLPVLLYYLTAFADASGEVSVRRDIYERDPPLLAVLAEPVRHARIAFPEPEPPAEATTAPPPPEETRARPGVPPAQSDLDPKDAPASIRSG